MKKQQWLVLCLILMSTFVFATRQTPDHLIVGNDSLKLHVGWGHPSPLQTYFRQNKDIKNPFRMISTANYRGHIATWNIENSRFYLIGLDVDGTKHKPTDFSIKSENSGFSNEKRVFADWFTGVIECRKINKDWSVPYTVYYYVKQGIVEREAKITNKELERLQEFTAKDTTNTELLSKYSMLYLNQSYISFYFRLYEREMVADKGKKGQLLGKEERSLVLDNYKSDYSDWPFNWESETYVGAPNGSYVIEDGKLLLESLELLSGLSFDGPEKSELNIKEFFKGKEFYKDKLFANWVSGVFIINFGKEEKGEFGMMRFKVKSSSIYKIENGVVKESYELPKNKKGLENIENDRLKDLVKEFQNQ